MSDQQSKTKPTGNKMASYRARLRAAGLRPVQIWIRDSRAPGFAKEANRQSRLVARGDAKSNDADFIEDLQADNLDLDGS